MSTITKTAADQKQLKALYAEELKKAWATEKMQIFLAKRAGYIVEHNGLLYCIEKPHIETSFCYGSGFCGRTTDEEEARASASARAVESDTDVFISSNLTEIDRQIKLLERIKSEMGINWAEGSYPVTMIYTNIEFIGQSSDCILRCFSPGRTYDNPRNIGERCDDIELIQKLIDGYNIVKADFIKRLNTYLKRHGLSKVDSWTYIRD